MKSLVKFYKLLGDFILLTRLRDAPPNIIIFDVAELVQDVVLTTLWLKIFDPGDVQPNHHLATYS